MNEVGFKNGGKVTMMLMDKLSPNVNIIPESQHQILRRVVSRFDSW